MNRVSEARRQHLSVVTLYGVYLADIGQQPQAIRGDIVKPTQEWGNDVRPRLCGQYRLGRGEAQSDVDLDAFVGQTAGSRQPVRGQRDLDDGVVRDLGDVVTLPHQLVGVVRSGLDRDLAVDDRTDLFNEREEVLLLLGDQRRVRGDASQHAPARPLADLV